MDSTDRKPALPKKVYLLRQSGAKLRYAQRGGGTFIRLMDATNRAKQLKQRSGGEWRLYECEPEWREIDLDI